MEKWMLDDWLKEYNRLAEKLDCISEDLKYREQIGDKLGAQRADIRWDMTIAKMDGMEKALKIFGYIVVEQYSHVTQNYEYVVVEKSQQNR